MIDNYGRWFPDYPGQQMYNDPAYMRMMRQQQQAMNQQQPQTQQMQQPTIQQSGFVLVPSEQEARNYPVAPGNSITFKDERAPYCYVKTMGFNQLDPPTFERYRLVKEESPVMAQNAPTAQDNNDRGKHTEYALKSDLDAIWDELDALRDKLKAQTERKPIKARKVDHETEDVDNE